jgi:hypothetical protein
MDSMSGLLTLLVITVFIFLIGREFICWYFKINKFVSNQEEIISALKKINNHKPEEQI